MLRISIPVALQSMLQSSFSMVDQIMVGQLGDKSVAAVEIAGKPSFIYAFVIGAISTITGIMISQYIGNHNREAEERSICINFLVMILTGLTFLSVFSLFQNPFVGMFTEEEQVIAEGSIYLGIISWTFIPLGICNILGTALRKGFPIFINEFLWSGGIAVLTQCYSIRGLNVVAGLNISNAICNMLNVVFVALGNAVGIVIGQMLGARQFDEAKKDSIHFLDLRWRRCQRN